MASWQQYLFLPCSYLIEELKTHGKDSDAGVALFMITGQRLGDDPQEWQEWWEKTDNAE